VQGMSGLGEALPCPGSPCQGNWHVYNIEVDHRSKPEKLSWSVDDITYHTITENDVGGDTWVQAVQHGHMVVLNVAIGGAFPNGNKGNATPGPGTVPGAPLYADWIAVYNSV
jgi:beta-glucanase (GH16 family)